LSDVAVFSAMLGAAFTPVFYVLLRTVEKRVMRNAMVHALKIP
jgi:uncharacterized MnhB-related membrane protein